MRIRKATPEEKAEYAAHIPRPVYPLYGWTALNGVRLAVEDLGGWWGKDDPQYEVVAPEGFHFAMNGTHSLLAFDLNDARTVLTGETLEPCTEECDG